MCTAVFYSLSTVCQYLTLFRLLVLCHYVHCCLLQSVRCLSVPHNVPSVGSMPLSPLLSSTVCPLSVSTSHCTVPWFCAPMSTAVFYSLSVPHTVPSVGSVSLCPLLSPTVCPLSVSTSHSICWLSPEGWSLCCSNMRCCFRVSAVINVSFSSVICQATEGSLLSLVGKFLGNII